MSESIDTIRILADQLAALHDDEDVRNTWATEFNEQLDELDTKYAALKADAKGNADAKRGMEAVAKGIPLFSKGVISAVQGFQKNDPIAGSAGVIDAVSSIITTIASISSTAGPAGAIVGAILSVVSMILKSFSAQKPTKALAQQLEEVIRNLKGEEWMQNLKMVREKSELFVGSITPDDYGKKSYERVRDDFKDNVIEGQKRIEDTAQWLEEPNNQELESWSVVLALQCFAYIAYTQALVMALSLVATEADRKDFKDDFFRTLMKQQLNFLRKILHVVRNRGTIWQSDFHGYLYNRTVVVSTKKSDWIKCGAAKGGEDARIQSFTVASRPSQTNAPVHPNLALFGTESLYGNRYRVIHVYDDVKTKPFSAAPMPFNPNYKFQGRFGQAPFSQYYGVVLKSESADFLKGLPPSYSVQAIPGREAHQVLVHTAHGDNIFFWKHGSDSHSGGEEQNLVYEGQRNMREGYLVGQVSAVFPKTTLKKVYSGPSFTAEEKCLNMIYSACEVEANKSHISENHAYKGKDHMEIGLDLRDYRFAEPFRFYNSGSFLSPWKDFVGVTTDPHYLWVYRSGAIACATHQNVWDCVSDGRTQPNWMIYEIPHEGISKDSYDPETEGKDSFNGRSYSFKRGLLDLVACADGTLTALFANANELEPIQKTASTNIYSMTPKIDLQAKTLKIDGVKTGNMDHPIPTSGWETDRSVSNAYRIAKQPIFCWDVVEALTQSLEEVVAADD